MKQIHIDRLRKLAAHLRSGILGHSEFNFAVLSRGPKQPNGCGTNGCALGELPFVFPEDWRLHVWEDYKQRGADWILRYNWRQQVSEKPGDHTARRIEWPDVEAFFGLKPYEAQYLFMPAEGDEEDDYDIDDPRLRPDATKEQVATRIEEFASEHEPYDLKGLE